MDKCVCVFVCVCVCERDQLNLCAWGLQCPLPSNCSTLQLVHDPFHLVSTATLCNSPRLQLPVCLCLQRGLDNRLPQEMNNNNTNAKQDTQHKYKIFLLLGIYVYANLLKCSCHFISFRSCGSVWIGLWYLFMLQDRRHACFYWPFFFPPTNEQWGYCVMNLDNS